VITRILPLNADKTEKSGEEGKAAGVDSPRRAHAAGGGLVDFEYIPSKEEVFDALAPLYIKGVIYGALVESYVSEQSARMTAMDEASKNAGDMLASLQVHYNRVRQAGITSEVSEIISGSAALNG
jgi:F-type H+-transporting ATPase subunit gamma